jgi:imidazoleglycerol-phosphate dehydratase/histidinol-phosphatase
MNELPILFVDRDGTLVEEPDDERVDRLDKVRLLPGVFAALQRLQRAGYRLVMVSNQDGIGSEQFPRAHFEQVHQFVLQLFSSQGIEFDAVFICPHFAHEQCECRKPRIGLVSAYLQTNSLDRARSAMIGDRDTDLEFARRLGIRGLRVRANGSAEESWPALVRTLLARRATVTRSTRETAIEVQVELDSAAASRIDTGIGFFDHMLEQLAKHAGFELQLRCRGDLHIDEHHTVEDCALALGEALRHALGDKSGIGRYGFLLAMDESEAQVALDLSGRAYFVFEGQFGRDQVGALPSELVPHFFRSLSQTLGAALHLSVRGENTHHMIEACFKGVGRALRPALRRDGEDLPSTKGVL